MAEKINDGGPVFPSEIGTISKGITLRQYAAIKLRVPNSGTDWLDAMIVAAKRDELAAMAMQSVLDGSWPDLHLKPKQHLSPIENSAVFAYEIADAMLKAGRQQ